MSKNRTFIGVLLLLLLFCVYTLIFINKQNIVTTIAYLSLLQVYNQPWGSLPMGQD